MKKILIVLIVFLAFFSIKMSISAGVSKTEKKVDIELYMTSQCQFSAMLKKSLSKARILFPEALNIKLYFIANFKDGKFTSMAGQNEIDEDIRQLVILKYYPEEFWEYLDLRDIDIRQPDSWQGILTILGVDSSIVQRIAKDEGEKLLLENIKKANELNIGVSPTLYINGELYEGRLDVTSIILAICRATGEDNKICKGLPECFSDEDCLRPNKEGRCLNKATLEAKCELTDLKPLEAILVNSKECRECDYYKEIIGFLSRRYRNLAVKEQDISDKNTKQLVEKLQIQSLPALLFKSDVNSYKHFQQDLNAGMFVKKDDNYYQVSEYLLNTKFFWNRPKVKDSLKIFIMSQCPFSISLTNQIARLIKDKKITHNIDFHYVLQKDASGAIGSLHGAPELEEDKRQLVIKKYYPNKFIDYLICRLQDINNLNWQECAKKFSIDVDNVTNKVNAESESMVNDEFKLAEELGINSSPVVLWENYYKITEVNELKKIKGFEALEKLTGSCGK